MSQTCSGRGIQCLGDEGIGRDFAPRDLSAEVVDESLEGSDFVFCYCEITDARGFRFDACSLDDGHGCGCSYDGTMVERS